MDEKTTNITGVIVECSIPTAAFKDVIGETMQGWLKRYGRVKVTVRENHNHDLVPLDLEFDYFMLVPGTLWNATFDYRAVVRGGPEDRIGQSVEGQINMEAPASSSHYGVLHAV
jgi:hypothetical protein